MSVVDFKNFLSKQNFSLGRYRYATTTNITALEYILKIRSWHDCIQIAFYVLVNCLNTQKLYVALAEQ